MKVISFGNMAIRNVFWYRSDVEFCFKTSVLWILPFSKGPWILLYTKRTQMRGNRPIK